jgi:alpha-L-fucosidase 2
MPDGTRSRFTYSATMDLEIVHDLFTNTIDAARVLGQDDAFVATLQQTMTRLPPLQISKRTGRLQEWIEDYAEVEPGHRHISHLFALYPGKQITLRGTPELTAAARKALDFRLSNRGGQTGWSRAWIVNFFARLEEGNPAHESVVALLRDNTTKTLLDLHPPQIFQIDGNLGATAGVAEMLLQSHAGELRILPALPAAWPNGRVTGLRARGGYEVDITWKDGRAREVRIKCAVDGPVRVRLSGKGDATVEQGVAGQTIAIAID